MPSDHMSALEEGWFAAERDSGAVYSSLDTEISSQVRSLSNVLQRCTYVPVTPVRALWGRTMSWYVPKSESMARGL
jgi:hypothetical protein